MIYEERVARPRAAMRGQNIDLLLLTPAPIFLSHRDEGHTV
jgi:hypothetical protein